MQRDEHVLALGHAGLLPGPSRAGGGLEAAQRVDHRVAHEVHPLRIDAFGCEVLLCLGAVGEEQIREPVGQNAVHFLGHRPIEGAQAGLDMRHRQRELGRGQRAGERRVDVTADADEVGATFEQDLLDLDQRAPGLLAVRPRSDAEEDVRAGELEIVQHLGRHALVVVLTGVHDGLRHVGAGREGFDDRRHLHEVGPRAYNMEYVKHPVLRDADAVATTNGERVDLAPYETVKMWSSLTGRRVAAP